MAAILGIVASLLGPALELGKCIAEPIKRQFNYLCCFNCNIQNLRDEAKKLDDARTGLQMRVTVAENNAEMVDPKVETWLKDVNEIQLSMTGIESEIVNIGSGCLTVKSRFSLSKKATKTAEALKELRNCCSFNPISHPTPPASMVPIPLGTTYEFESRKQIEEDIITTLKSKRVNMIGICGMGGVGKTTMAKRLVNRVKEENLFVETVMVVVSQQVDMLRIQDDVAKSLGLKLEEGSLSSNAHYLRTRLQGGKKILIVLDDVWKYLKLEDLGIPCESGLECCTILLTSRDSSVLIEMNAQKVCGIQTLSEVEARFLFEENIGVLDDQDLISISRKIVEECKGLPLALVNVAVSLKDKKHKFIWEDALEQLKSSIPEDMPKILEDVYKPLKLSYDFLDSQHAKSIFLLCCLFPEDSNISLEYLTVYAMGLCMFERIRNVGQVRNRTFSLVHMLKSRFLLLEGQDPYHVRMHDVVRDVAIFIASQERRINCSGCAWISSNHLGESTELTLEPNSNLRLLLIDKSAKDKVKINENIFEGMGELHVLSISNDSLISLPHTIKSLKNLHTLILDSCTFLETISIVGELLSLEILICRHCCSIKELPLEIGRLNRLRLLDLSHCTRLKKIAPGVISSLIRLEELKMKCIFCKWEGEEDNERKERENARLSELQSLSNLTCLEIEVEDSTLATQNMNLSPIMVKYNISIGLPSSDDYSLAMFEKKMKLCLQRENSLGNWIWKCARSVEYLQLESDGSNSLDLGQAHQSMRALVYKSCSMVKKLVNITTSSSIFPLLEYLKLENLPNLEEICDVDGPIPANYFKNLKELKLEKLPALKHLWKSDPYQNNVVSICNNLSSIEIRYCSSLRNLFSFSMATKDCLPRLERLEIKGCKMMEEVFLWKEEENDEKKDIPIEFPKLKTVQLWNLPNLTTFCRGIGSIEFPLLNKMRIEGCPQLKSLMTTTTLSGTNQNNSGCIKNEYFFPTPEMVAYAGLEELRIEILNIKLWCPQIPLNFFSRLNQLHISRDCSRSLFLFSVAREFVNLKRLTIWYCYKMVKMIEDKEEEREDKHVLLFPQLQYLCLECLPRLEIFCEWRCALELPSLRQVEVINCCKMERFSLESLITPNLRSIHIDGKNIINSTKDLNGVVQQEYFLRVEEEEKKKRKEEERQEKERVQRTRKEDMK